MDCSFPLTSSSESTMSSKSSSAEESSGEDYHKILTNIINYNGVGFALLMAKETGILKALLAANAPLTSHEIANRQNLKERYTREILAALVVVRLVKATVADQNGHLYFLEESAKYSLNSGLHMPNMAKLHIFASRYDVIKQCTSRQGPLNFDGFWSEFDGYVSEMNTICDDKCIDFILTKAQEIKRRLERGIRVLEFASGDGSLLAKLAERFPNSQFTASEVSEECVVKMTSLWCHVPNMNIKQYDMCAMPDSAKTTFDWILMRNVTHILPHPGSALKTVREMVRENGFLTVIDFVGKGDPLKCLGNKDLAMSYVFSLFNCIPLSYQKEDSEAHGCGWSEETALQIFHEAGFEVSSFPYLYPQMLFLCKPV